VYSCAENRLHCVTQTGRSVFGGSALNLMSNRNSNYCICFFLMDFTTCCFH